MRWSSKVTSPPTSSASLTCESCGDGGKGEWVYVCGEMSVWLIKWVGVVY